MDDLIRRQLLVELHRADYHEAYYDEERDAILPMDKEFPGIRIYNDEIRMPRLEQPPYILGQKAVFREDLQARQNDLVYNVFRPITDRVNEMAYAWRNALSMKDQDVAEFRLLSEYGKIVLAARDDGVYGLHFVTWEYGYDRRSVGLGHYTMDYEAAKRDFALRAGLIPEKQLFEKDELKQMYSALIFQGRNDDELTFEQEKSLRDIIQKLEDISGDIKDSQNPPAQDYEVEPEP